MNYHRILTIQDISCVGQCSMTVAMPILSACGLETCILPSAVLSTHTGGFVAPTFRDLTEDIPGIWQHWQREGITFDGVYTGYLGSTRQIAMVREILENMAAKKGKTVVDPAMADHGKLYKGFDQGYVDSMKSLCCRADVILPNLTEACMLTDTAWQEDLPRETIFEIVQKLHALEAKNIVLTGIGDRPGDTGALISDGQSIRCFSHKKVGRNYHGTGDIFASVFFGAWMQGKDLYDAAALAARFVSRAVELTMKDSGHWYGVHFEKVLPWLMKELAV